MRIGIDIDDTIMDTFDYMVPFVAEYFGLDPDEMRKNDISYSTLPDGLREREFEFGRKYYDKVVPDTPVKTGAAEYIKKLHDAHFIYYHGKGRKTVFRRVQDYFGTVEKERYRIRQTCLCV